MNAMFTGFGAIVLIAGLAWYGLGQAGFSAEEINSGANVRLD